MEEKLSKLYYQPNHLWTGENAIKQLRQQLKVSRKVALQWFAKQAIFQIHLPAPKEVIHPHYQVYVPNQMHMVDLLEFPRDFIHGNTYKYLLVLVDVASGYTAIVPLRNKQASSVAFALKALYRPAAPLKEHKHAPLKFPKELYSDAGTEFKGEFAKMLKEHGVKVKAKVTKYHHGFNGKVESRNKAISKMLFKNMDVQEIASGKTSRTWVKYARDAVEKLNHNVNGVLGMSPAEAIKLDVVKPKKAVRYPKEKLLPADGLYRYLLAPGEEHGDQRRRATDNIWSRKTFRISDIEQIPGQRVLYHLSEGPDRAFVKEELMLIPEDTQDPPEYVKAW